MNRNPWKHSVNSRTIAAIRSALQCVMLLLAFNLSGCDDDDPIGPDNPELGGGLKVLGLISSGEPPVQVLVVWNNLPVTDAQVTLNGEQVPFSGIVTPEACENCFYDLASVELAPGTEYVLEVHTTHGDKEFTAIMPDSPVITSPASDAIFGDNESIPVTWAAVPNATRLHVGLMPSYGLVFPTYDHVSGSSTQFTIPANKTVPLSFDQTIEVGAMNGEGEYFLENLLTLDPPDGFYAVNWSSLTIRVTD